MALTSSEISAMRTVADSFLSETCVIMSGSTVGDAETWVSAGSCLCHVRQAQTGREQVIGAQMQTSASRVIIVAAGVVITADQQLVVDGHTYRVNAVPDETWTITKKIDCTEIA